MSVVYLLLSLAHSLTHSLSLSLCRYGAYQLVGDSFPPGVASLVSGTAGEERRRGGGAGNRAQHTSPLNSIRYMTSPYLLATSSQHNTTQHNTTLHFLLRALKRYWQSRLLPMVEAWIGGDIPLETSDIYGIRR